MFRWEFGKKGQELTVDVPGALTLGQQDLVAEAAADGLGIASILRPLRTLAWAARCR